MCLACAVFDLPSALFHSEFVADGAPSDPVTGPSFVSVQDYAGAAALPLPTFGTVAPTGDALRDGLMSGVRWTSPVLTYSFPSSDAEFDGVADGMYTAGSYTHTNVTLVSPAQREATRQILEGTSVSSGPFWAGVADFTHLDFAEIGGFGQGAGSAAGDIRVTQSTLPDGIGGWAGYPGSSITAGDVWMSGDPFLHWGVLWDNRDPVPGNYAWNVLVHELGHALGLRHGHVAANGFAALPAALDSKEFSIMTYRSYVGQDPVSSRAEIWSFPQSFMMADIFALQRLYGADYGHHAGNTTYSWSPTTGQMSIDGVGQIAPGGNKVFLTIWDGGGTDTYDMSNYATGVNIDLRPGKWSITAEGQRADLNFDEVANPTQLAQGNVYNSLLFGGNAASLIENAVGGAGLDVIRGNAAANRLQGGEGGDSLVGDAGNDTLLGEAGADTLVGGAGTDSMAGGLGNDVYRVDDTDIVSEAGGGGYDRVLAVWDWTLGEGFERLTLTGTLDAWGFGNAGANRLDGNSNANWLDGHAGNDTLYGMDGADTLLGGAGNDSMAGGLGNDRYYVDGGDTISEAGGNGYDRVLAAWDWTLGDGFERLTLTGTLDAWGYGNAAANWLDGNGGANRLEGRAGGDRLYGLAGDDTLHGGLGADLLDGGAGSDAFLILETAERGDTIIGYQGAEDRIEVSAGGFRGGLTEAMDLFATGRFLANTTGLAESAAGTGQFVWETDAEVLWWDRDGMDGLAAYRLATLPGASLMGAGEIVVLA